MKNVRIEVRKNNHIVVIADTKKYSNDVVFESYTFAECIAYIKAALNRQILKARGYTGVMHTDTAGVSYPAYMTIS